MSIIPMLNIGVTTSGGGGSSPLVLSISPSPYAYGQRFGSGTVTSNVVTVNVSGGVGAKTYGWLKISGDTITATAASAAATAFTGTIGLNQVKTAIFECTVTDSLGATATILVNVSLEEASYS